MLPQVNCSDNNNDESFLLSEDVAIVLIESFVVDWLVMSSLLRFPWLTLVLNTNNTCQHSVQRIPFNMKTGMFSWANIISETQNKLKVERLAWIYMLHKLGDIVFQSPTRLVFILVIVDFYITKVM